MSKWADFVITAVRYNSDRSHIVSVQRYKDLGSKLGELQTRTRDAIIEAIGGGVKYVTANKNKDGDWVKGSPVMIIEVDGVEYIKTENNKTAKDNLENLPEF